MTATVIMLPTAAAEPPPNPVRRRGRYPRGVIGIWRGDVLRWQRERREKEAKAAARALEHELQIAVSAKNEAARKVAELAATLSARLRETARQAE